MGRYYSGDIEGKFWFGVQDSNDADHFGVIGEAPSQLEYYFDKEDIHKVMDGINVCKKNLGTYKSKIDKFFKSKDSYNDEMLAKYLKVDVPKVRELLTEYARLRLGLKIKKCITAQGYCSFSAEC